MIDCCSDLKGMRGQFLAALHNLEEHTNKVIRRLSAPNFNDQKIELEMNLYSAKIQSILWVLTKTKPHFLACRCNVESQNQQ